MAEKIRPEEIIQPVNRTRGFVNLNRVKFAKAIKRLSKVSYDKPRQRRAESGQGKRQPW